ncbi:uncharacterized protein LOC143036205 [Oratosquilla oratoria]|uniref:uncharacterized protein LOC143036205 n=1 Tax=Oratosquilla oratoria TaxID=337810 RepID=UPI003F75F356
MVVKVSTLFALVAIATADVLFESHINSPSNTDSHGSSSHFGVSPPATTPALPLFVNNIVDQPPFPVQPDFTQLLPQQPPQSQPLPESLPIAQVPHSVHSHQFVGAPQVPAQYNFEWAVNDAASGNYFGHQESRYGDYTQGSYHVLLPDGRLQRVNYNVQGDSGFLAHVSYEGQPTSNFFVPVNPFPRPRQFDNGHQVTSDGN